MLKGANYLLEEINSYNMIKIELKKNDGEVIMVGHPADVREKIEDMLSEKLGFYPSLQEDVEDGVYWVCVHSDTYEDLEEEQIEKLEDLDITDFEETCTEAIKRFLGVEFKFVV